MSIRTAALVVLALASVACQGPRAADGVRVAEASATAWTTIGTSREGRPIHARRLGMGGPRLCVIANIHGNENEGLRHLDAFLPLLERAPWTVLLIEDVNPDGTAAQTRGTSAGVDPNRNWPASNYRPDEGRGPEALSEPGVRATHAALVEFDPEMVVVLHSTSRGPFVNYDGPAASDARRFAEAAGDPWTVEPSMGYPTPGSLGTFMGIDRNVPILTVEFRRAAPPEETRGPLLRGLAAVIDQVPVGPSVR